MNEAETLTPPASTVAPTKDRILDAAERLFGARGFEATPLRAITTEAGVNLAAVNYHFQSKEALIRAVIARRIAPVNERRLKLLDDAETGPLSIEAVIEAFIRPVIEMRFRGPRTIGPMVGRIFAEDKAFVERFYEEHLAAIAKRFGAAFERALPDVSREDMYWTAHFLIGAMAHSMSSEHLLVALSGGLCHMDDPDAAVRRMVIAFAAAFRAQAKEVVHE